MLVVVDTFSWEDYNVGIAPEEDFWRVWESYDERNKQRIMECYDTSKSWESQAVGRMKNSPLWKDPMEERVETHG